MTKLIEKIAETEVAQRATIDQIEMSLGAIFTHLLNRNTIHLNNSVIEKKIKEKFKPCRHRENRHD